MAVSHKKKAFVGNISARRAERSPIAALNQGRAYGCSGFLIFFFLFTFP